MQTHVSANEIADRLLWLWSQEAEEDRDFFTPMKLQKLLYYVQGWSLAERDEPAFKEQIEAWRDGPVVRVVWERFKDHGKEPIREGPAVEPTLPPAIARLTREVWEVYRRYSAWELRRRTHDESPWIEAWGDMPRDAKGSTPLRAQTMRNEFREQIGIAKRRLLDRADSLLERARQNTLRATGRTAL